MINDKRLFLVATAFPPSYGSGIARMMRFCHRLPEIGYFPVVLTTAAQGFSKYPNANELEIKGEILRAPLTSLTNSLLKRLPPTADSSNRAGQSQPTANNFTSESKVKRLLKTMYHNLFEFPDAANLWIDAASQQGLRYLKSNPVSVIYSSSPSVSSHFVASSLAKKTGLPWVMEFRDLWVDNPWHPDYLWWRRRLDFLFERSFARQAARIITVSEGSKNILETRYPFIKGRVAVVSNGFEPGEYRQPLETAQRLPLTLLHTGTFYKGRRDISGLYQAIEFISNKHPQMQACLRVQIAGDYEKYAVKQAAKMGVAGYVNDLGVLPSEEALQLQQSCHILLLIEASEDSEWVYSNLPGKLYEYLGANKPILALVNPNSMLAQVIRDTKTGVVIHPQDWQEIAVYLERAVGLLQSGGAIPHQANQAVVDQYNWGNLIKKVGAVLDDIA